MPTIPNLNDSQATVEIQKVMDELALKGNTKSRIASILNYLNIKTGSSWSLSGNNILNSNYLGSTNDINLTLIRNAQVYISLLTGGITHLSGKLGINTPTPEAALEIKSTTDGFLIPRLNQTQINAIVSPAQSLLLYNTSLNQYQFFRVDKWVPFLADRTEIGFSADGTLDNGFNVPVEGVKNLIFNELQFGYVIDEATKTILITTKPSFPENGNNGEVLVKAEGSAIWSSIIKGVEFLGNAILKLKIITFSGYTIAQKNAIASPVEGMLIYQNESPKGFQKYEGGTWSAIGSNISNADLSNVSARTFTQGNTFTWNTGGIGYYLKGLVDKTGQAAYTKVVVIHPTTGETVTRDFADPQATTLAVQNANTTQKTAMRTALLGTAVPASPTISDCFPSFIKKGVNTTIYLSGLNLTLLDPSSIWIENGAAKIYATSFANVNTTLIVTTWDIPIDLPNANYSVKIQNGVAVQGLSTGLITVIDGYSIINLEIANWRHIFGRNNAGVLYTVVPAMNANNLVSQNFLQTYMPYPVEDTNVPDNTSGHLWITNNFIAKDKDYEIIIDYEIFADPNGAGGVPSYYIGLTNSDGSLINEITDINVTGNITGDFRSIFGQSNWNFKQLNRIVIIKTGNKVMAKLYDYLGNYIKQQIWTLPDMTKDFAFYIREPRSRIYYFARKYYFNIRKKI